MTIYKIHYLYVKTSSILIMKGRHFRRIYDERLLKNAISHVGDAAPIKAVSDINEKTIIYNLG